MRDIYIIIALAPLAAALIAGLLGRKIGRAGAHSVTILGVGLSCVLSATVVRCHEWYENAWFLGCKLSRPLNDEETLSLL